MTNSNPRIDFRQSLQLREINIKTGVNRYAEGSCLFIQGHTQVLCTVSIENKIPKHIKDKNDGSGWLTAEYAMLPRSTHTRSERERQRVNARASEIQRLIGRSLRSMVDLSKIGERTITIDCDVLQADAGTRCAAINGGAIALAIAIENLQKQNIITQNPLKSLVCALSLVYINGEILIDPCYLEDSNADVDMNVVANAEGGIIEIQTCSEKTPPKIEIINQMVSECSKSIQEVITLMKKAIDLEKISAK